MKRLTTDLFVRSMNEQISCGFLLKICVRAELIGVLIDQKAVAQMWLWWCVDRSSCSDVDLRWIKATAESDVDPPYMESPNGPTGHIISTRDRSHDLLK